MTDLLDLTIRDVGRLIMRRDISAVDLIDAALERLTKTESHTHAFARVLSDAARDQAKQSDEELANGTWRGPLHGIPIGVKDLCYMSGVPTLAGSDVLEGFTPRFDSEVVSRLRTAGAIILGKTITHEFALGQNVVETKNPWGDSFYPGGSSAGSAVGVAMRSIYGSIGTDTAGSIRSPAAINGIVGLKPTYGRVSRYGVIPASPSLDHVGPMARTVEDCALVLQAISGYDAKDPASSRHPVEDLCEEPQMSLAGTRVGIERDYFLSSRVDGEVRSAVEAALTQLESAGAHIVELTMPILNHAAAAGLTILSVEASAVHRKLLRHSAARYSPGTRLLLQAGELVPGTDYVRAQQGRTLVRNAVRNVYSAYQLDVMVAPTLPVPTIPLESLSVSLAEVGETSLSGFVKHCIPANVTGQPAISVPCAYTAGGLPIGLQLIGRPFMEARLIRVARAYEASNVSHRRLPPLLERLGNSGGVPKS